MPDAIETLLMHLGEDPEAYFGAVAPPIVQTSLFTFPTFDAFYRLTQGDKSRYAYTRERAPVHDMVAAKLAALEGAERAQLFASGMGAIAAALLAHLKTGDHILASHEIYGPAQALLGHLRDRFGMTLTYADASDTAAFVGEMRPETRMVYLESPSTLTFNIQDIGAISAAAHAAGALVMVDNSYATPLFQKPLALGADLVVHSATKYLGGHSDLLAGVVCGSAEVMKPVGAFGHSLLGAVSGPLDAWLLQRGLRTLPLRLKRHQESAAAVAEFSRAHPKVIRVCYPGSPDHPQRALIERQMSGATGLLSFELDTDVDGAARFCDTLRLFGLGWSWGGYESLVVPTGPMAAKARGEKRPSGLIRLSIGLEDVGDLVRDLEAGLAVV